MVRESHTGVEVFERELLNFYLEDDSHEDGYVQAVRTTPIFRVELGPRGGHIQCLRVHNGVPCRGAATLEGLGNCIFFECQHARSMFMRQDWNNGNTI